MAVLFREGDRCYLQEGWSRPSWVKTKSRIVKAIQVFGNDETVSLVQVRFKDGNSDMFPSTALTLLSRLVPRS